MMMMVMMVHTILKLNYENHRWCGLCVNLLDKYLKFGERTAMTQLVNKYTTINIQRHSLITFA